LIFPTIKRIKKRPREALFIVYQGRFLVGQYKNREKKAPLIHPKKLQDGLGSTPIKRAMAQPELSSKGRAT
jgi:hypothetical protein